VAVNADRSHPLIVTSSSSPRCLLIIDAVERKRRGSELWKLTNIRLSLPARVLRASVSTRQKENEKTRPARDHPPAEREIEGARERERGREMAPAPLLSMAASGRATAKAAVLAAAGSELLRRATVEARSLSSVNHTQAVTIGIIAVYAVVIGILWNVPYLRAILWPFKVRAGQRETGLDSLASQNQH